MARPRVWFDHRGMGHYQGLHNWLRATFAKSGRCEPGRAYQGELAGGEVFTGRWTGKLDHGAEPIFKHVDDPTRERTFRNGKFYGRLSDVKP